MDKVVGEPIPDRPFLDYWRNRALKAEAALAAVQDPSAEGQGECCTDCDGRGFYSVWPHTTCPTCEGSGLERPSGAVQPPAREDASRRDELTPAEARRAARTKALKKDQLTLDDAA